MGVCFEGYDEKVLTFEKDTGDIAVGYPVKISGNGKVSQCNSGDEFCGFAVSVRENLVAVQMSGYREAGYVDGSEGSDPKINLGYSTVTAGTAGNLSATASGKSILVVSKDDTNNVIGFIF